MNENLFGNLSEARRIIEEGRINYNINSPYTSLDGQSLTEFAKRLRFTRPASLEFREGSAQLVVAKTTSTNNTSTDSATERPGSGTNIIRCPTLSPRDIVVMDNAACQKSQAVCSAIRIAVGTPALCATQQPRSEFIARVFSKLQHCTRDAGTRTWDKAWRASEPHWNGSHPKSAQTTLKMNDMLLRNPETRYGQDPLISVWWHDSRFENER